MKKAGASFFVLLLLLPFAAEAAKIPAPRGYVNDYGNMISSSTEADLNAKLKTFEETDSTQIVVLTVPSLEGEPLEDYSLKVAEAWKIGQKVKDNGVLFLVSRDDRKMRIEVGRGLEGKLTDLTAGRIIDLVVKPKFRGEDYDGGFTGGVSALIDATRGEFTADKRAPSGEQEPYPFAGEMPSWFAFLILMFFFVFFAAMARSRSRNNQLRRRDLRSRRLRRSGPWIGYPPYPGGYRREGWSTRDERDTDYDSGDGGGFSGGGGGFGGGGASGSW